MQCVYLFCLAKKKQKNRKKLKENGKVHSNWALSSLAVLAVVLQFLDNLLSHQIQNTVKLTFSLLSHTTTTTALLTQVSIRAARFC